MRIKHNLIRLAAFGLLVSLLMTGVFAMPGQYGSGMEGGSGVAALTTAAGDLSCFDRFTVRELSAGETLRKGVDVSYYQGNIDWQAAADSGLEFAIIRVAYRAWGTGALYYDQFYQRNIEGALDAGLQVGVYIYSQATTEDEAAEEAQFVLDLVDGYPLQLPIVMDLEYGESGGHFTGRLYNAGLSSEEATAICNSFCATVREAGYMPMIYANRNMLENSLNADELEGLVWLANYTTMTGYAGDYAFWQCAANGAVPGIDYECDIDFWFDDGTLDGALEMPFLDVRKDRWSYESVLYCYLNGIVNGRSATKFEPAAYITRGEVVTMLYRAAGEPAVEGQCVFTDLTLNYYKTPILWAQLKGVTNGRTSVTFEPEANITRQEFVTMLYRYAGEPAVSGTLEGYSDAAQIHSYAKDAMLWAVQNGIMNGTSPTTLSPTSFATREQIATLLARFLQH